MNLKDGLELRRDGSVRKDGRRATPEDVPVRRDLPPDHPLCGRRCVRNVPAGMPDCTIDDEGNLVPLEEFSEEPDIVDVPFSG
jgi:hypothetical protein